MSEKFRADFYQNFIEDDRWKYIVNGLGNTIKITLFAVLLGIALGFLVAIIRSTFEKTGKLKLLNLLCRVYLTVIRRTPVLIQLLLIYFVVFGSVRIDKSLVAILAFGINSGAYVAEIIRGGLMSVDAGLETGVNEKGFDAKTDKLLVDVNPEFYRPAEVEFLWGNCEKAEKELGWKRNVDFKGLVAMMMDADLKEIAGMSCQEYRNKLHDGKSENVAGE